MKYLQNQAVATPVGRVLAFRPRHLAAAPAHALYGDALERGWHQHSIKLLAETTAQPMQVVTPMYEQVLAELRPAARLKDYLPIFVSRRVRRMLGA
ncbi:DUF3562 domain-containing protein [Janthinobacterium sp. 17J80-10]|uniref:DUF3562 domain-containing protein n=1 Tax=Janthinobacterium sp. 17J80-10 TaxID=2497863 RepID=UPI0010059C82|nr:DUF3562 domain-containing protein [Janthinobacterium sp. 17J80-10]QAU32782.1 DUF3562 domain-containing protein [Janthinobacterium sp. 17J80-10]